MKIRKHKLLVAGGAALILTLAAMFILYRFYKAYDRVSMDLQSAMGQLRSLQERAPYPSRENAALVRTHLVIFQNYFDGLFNILRQGQIEPVETEAAKFTPLLRDGILRVSRRAREVGVMLPATFDMGMERYKRGDLPSRTDVPRLVVQLKTLEALCGLLIDAKVTEIVSVKRSIFERGTDSQETPTGNAGRWSRGGAPAPEASPARPMPAETTDSSGLFSLEPFTIEFKGPERSVWNILNALIKSPLFTVVTSIAVVNDNPAPNMAAKQPASAPPSSDVMPGTPPAAADAKQPLEVKTREQTVIAGREIVKVVLDVDVYRFLGGEKQETKL
jgi:hypothetical protein